jgi:hypothetical protein
MRLPISATKPRAERGAVALGKRHRGANARAHAAVLGVEQIPVRQHDGPEMIRAALSGDEGEEVTGQRRELQALADLSGDRALVGRADPRPAEHGAERTVLRQHGRRALDLASDLLGLLALARQLEQGLGIGLGDRGRCFHAVFMPAIASATIRRWSSSRKVRWTSFSATAIARSLTSRRSSSRARRTSASSCAFVSSTSLRDWA